MPPPDSAATRAATPTSFPEDCKQVLQGLRGALTSALATVGVDPARPQDMARTLGLHRNLIRLRCSPRVRAMSWGRAGSTPTVASADVRAPRSPWRTCLQSSGKEVGVAARVAAESGGGMVTRGGSWRADGCHPRPLHASGWQQR